MKRTNVGQSEEILFILSKEFRGSPRKRWKS
jgi:hypothetical protein